jgi:hypothetical protein
MGMLEAIRESLGINSQSNQELGSFETEDTGVNWIPEIIKPGDKVQINYQGLLKNSGAKEVFLHYGFDSWTSLPQTVRMEQRVNGGFATSIQAAGKLEVNFCFKDPAGHWDNNNGLNWALPLQ